MASGPTIGTKLDPLAAVRVYQRGSLLTETLEKCVVPVFELPFALPGDSGALIFNHHGKGEGIIWAGGVVPPRKNNNDEIGTTLEADNSVIITFDPPAPEVDTSKLVFYTELKHIRNYIREKLDAEHGNGKYQVYWGRGGDLWI